MALDVNALCRMCAKPYSVSVSVQVKCENQRTVLELLQEHLNLSVHGNDGLPTRVCLPCLEHLRNWDRLKLQVVHAQIYLRETFLPPSLEDDVSGDTSLSQFCLVSLTRSNQSIKTSLEETKNDHWENSFVKDDESESKADSSYGDRNEESDGSDESSESTLAPMIYEEHELEETKQNEVINDSSDVEERTPTNKTEKGKILSQYLRKKKGNKIKKEKRPHECLICAKQFACQSDLARHMRVHTGERPFKCDLCPLCFNQSSTLQRHVMTHTGEKPFMCQHCSKCFSKRFLLSKHLLTHTDTRPHSCPDCSKTFRDRSNLRTHMASHSMDKPFMCHQCSKCFNLRTALNRHLRSHTSEKPFQCEQCSNRFATKANLKTHLLIHTGEKKFQCDICSRCFTYKSSLKKHTASHVRGRLMTNNNASSLPERPYVCYPVSSYGVL